MKPSHGTAACKPLHNLNLLPWAVVCKPELLFVVELAVEITFDRKQSSLGRRPVGAGEAADAFARDHAMAGNDDRESVRLHRRSNRPGSIGRTRLGRERSIRHCGSVRNLTTRLQDIALKFRSPGIVKLNLGQRDILARRVIDQQLLPSFFRIRKTIKRSFNSARNPIRSSRVVKRLSEPITELATG